MMQLVISKQTLDWLEALCDIPAKPKDSNEILRWKAAQRDVFLRAQSFYNTQLDPNSKTSKAEELGYNIKSDQ
jgi:hypothetical protein